MLPNIYVIAGLPVSLHDTIVMIGLAAGGLVLLIEARRRQLVADHFWWVLLGSLLGAAIGARIGPLMLEIDLRDPASFERAWLGGNRSILGALAGAYAGVLIAKRATGWRVATGDAFAPAVALGMAIGRIGCLLTELPGSPTGGDWGIVLSQEQAARLPGGVAGVPLHPSFVYEIVFHAVAFAWLWAVRKRPYAPDVLFRRYVLAYAAFRFCVEFVRGNEVLVWGLSRPQWFLLVLTAVGLLWRLGVRRGWWRAVAAATRRLLGGSLGTRTGRVK